MNDRQQIIKQMIFVNIDSYVDKEVSGTLWYGCMEKEAPFKNLMQLLLLIDKILEEQGFPEVQLRYKRFTDAEAIKSSLRGNPAEAGKPSCGALANFLLKIIFRQNASWQGTVTWAGSRKEQSFRSALELIMLLDSALTHAAALNSKQIG